MADKAPKSNLCRAAVTIMNDIAPGQHKSITKVSSKASWVVGSAEHYPILHGTAVTTAPSMALGQLSARIVATALAAA